MLLQIANYYLPHSSPTKRPSGQRGKLSTLITSTTLPGLRGRGHWTLSTNHKAPRKTPRKALRRAAASQCVRASQNRAFRIAAIAFVHVNYTTQSRVTLIHCIAHQLLVNLVAGVMFAPPCQGGVGPAVRMGRRTGGRLASENPYLTG